MVDFLRNNIIGQLGDQIGSLWLGDIFFTKKFYLLNYYSIDFFKNIQPHYTENLFSNIYNFIYLTLSYFLGGVLAYNLLTFLILVANSFSFYYLLKQLKIKRIISLIFSFFFSLIPYFYMHFEHQTLLVLFPSIFIISYLLRVDLTNISYKNFLVIAICTTLQGLFSLYLIYFLTIYLFLYFLVSSILQREFKIIMNFVLIMGLTAAMFLLFNFNLVLGYFSPSRTQVSFNFPNKNISQSVTGYFFDRERPLNDFLYFSSRPWYYFLAPTTHPILGNSTKDLIYYFSENRNYWIFKNHFPYEHNASFIGYSIIALSLIAFLNKNLRKNLLIRNFFILNIFLFILSMPPYFTFNGINIYTPSYILYLLFPMFRSLARIVIFIQINFFIISALTLNEITRKMTSRSSYIVVFLISLCLVLDFMTNYKFTKVSVNSETNYFLLNTNQEKKMVAVYPNSFRNEFLLNMRFHESPFFNPSGLVKSEIYFDSGKFTSNIDTCENLSYFSNFNGKYIVIRDFKNYEFKYLNEFPTIFVSEAENITIKSIENISKICN